MAVTPQFPSLDEICHSLHRAVIATDANDRITFWNNSAETMYGWKAAEVIGRRIGEIAPSGASREQSDEIHRQLAAGRTWSGEYTVSRRDGSEFLAHVELSPLITPGGEAAGVFAISDVRDEVSDAELRARRLETRYRSLVDEAQDLIYTCDVEGRFTSLNPAFERMTGWKCEAWIGRPFTDLAVSEPSSSHANTLEALRFHPSSITEETRLRTAGGKSIVVEWNARALHVDGRMSGIIGVMRDITERRRLELALDRSARFTALGRLAATLSHEFNNVLMSIQGTTDLLQRQSLDPAAGRATKALASAIQRGSHVTQDVLRFATMPEPELHTLDLAVMIEKLQPELEGLAGENIRIEKSLEAGSNVRVAGDRALLQQIITNLVINARDAMPAGGTITIVLEERADPASCEPVAVLTVSDTGCGISPDALPFIFEPLFTTKKAGGTGLGLSVVAQIVARHRGTVTVRSTPGEGTSFEIVLPGVIAQAPDEIHPARTVRAAGRILVVEDDETIASGLQAVLELEGITTATVSLGAEVVACVEHFAPDLVLLDLGLPDMSGAAVYLQLIERWPDVAVIITSGHSAEPEMLALIGGRRGAFLLKPYDIETLLRTVADVIAG